MLFTALNLASITSHIHKWVLFLYWLHPFILSGVISPLISRSILGTYGPGEFIFQCPIFLPFHTSLWPQVNNNEGTQPHPSTENWIKDLLCMAPAIRTRPSFPFSQSLPSGSFHKPLILLHQRADNMNTTITGK